MSFIVTVVHVFVSLFLMLTVLLQAGKGGGMGASFGGGSSQGSVFGGSGAGNFLSRLTTLSALVFMLTSMTLAFLASTTGDDPLKKNSAQQRAFAKRQAALADGARDTLPDDEVAPASDASISESSDEGDEAAPGAGGDEDGARVDEAEADLLKEAPPATMKAPPASESGAKAPTAPKAPAKVEPANEPVKPSLPKPPEASGGEAAQP